MAKHIVLFISSLHKAGAERVMSNLTKMLTDRGVKVTLVTQYRSENEFPIPEQVQRVYSEITPEETKKTRLGNFIARYKKLRQTFQKLDPDCVLAFTGKNNLMAIAATRGTGIPVIVSVRGDPKCEYYTTILRICAKVLFAAAEGVVFQTHEAQDYFPAAVKRRSVILRNPIGADFIRPRYEGERERRIVSVGRFHVSKNHWMVITALSRMAEEFPEVRLSIYGEGECRKELEELVQKLGMGDRIELPGSVSGIADKIYKASVFVLTSDSEGTPNSLIEAMCMGVPSISTDCPAGGPRELINHGENGYLIPMYDVDALEKHLRMLLSDDALRERISIQAAKLSKEFAPEKVNQEWMEYLLSKCRKSAR